MIKGFFPQGLQEIQGNWTRETCEFLCDNTVCKGINKVNEFQTKFLFE